MRTRKQNRMVTFCLCFMLFVLMAFQLECCNAFAQGVNIPTVRENVYVYDDEDLLTDEQEQDLNKILRYLDENTTVEFAVITADSFGGYSIEDYAHDLFNGLGLGKSGKDNGILLLISASEGHGRLEIGYGIEDILTDAKCGAILDKYYVPLRDKGEHGDSVYDTTLGVLSVLGDHYGIELVENQDEIIKNIEESDRAMQIVQIVIAIILICIWLWVKISVGGSGGGYYGGGFRSSGGGGHFGGGFSGGGGASR